MNSAQQDPGPSGHSVGQVTALRSLKDERELQALWDRHGTSVYALACALLGDEADAMKAVTLGMTDLALADDRVAAADARRDLARHVYRRSQELLGGAPTPPHLPPAMVWIARLAPLQRACLALCCFGGLTHRETAELLAVPAVTVAELLTAGLREMARFPAVRSATA